MKRLSRRGWLSLFAAALALILGAGVAIAFQARSALARSAFTFDDLQKSKVYINDDGEAAIYYDPQAPAGYTAANFSLAKGNVTVAEVYDRAEVIARVRATGDRSFAYNATLTKGVVTAVYKGDPSLVSQEIYVYEAMAPNYFLMWQPLDGAAGYHLMNTGDEYYLFLNRRPMPEGYRYTPKDLKTYLLTNVHLGKYKADVCAELKVLTPPQAAEAEWMDALPAYQQVKAWDILPVHQDQIAAYLSNRREALRLLGAGANGDR